MLDLRCDVRKRLLLFIFNLSLHGTHAIRLYGVGMRFILYSQIGLGEGDFPAFQTEG